MTHTSLSYRVEAGRRARTRVLLPLAVYAALVATSAALPASEPLARPPAPALPAQASPAAAAPDTQLAAAELPPLPPAWTQALQGIVEDPAPPALVRDQHYVISNESRHDLFRDSALGRGGVYIGVGSDQNYLLAGWARPELLVLFDFDQVVVNVHRVYRAFFLNAATPEEFLELWNVKNEARAEALLAAEYTEPARRAAVVRAYRMARYAVTRRFRQVLLTYKAHGVTSFLDDPAQYRYLASLFRGGRVVMVRGDLTAGTSMSSIATAVQKLGSTVRLLYLSNAERYFTYTDAFRQSLLALPTDERSMVLRTRARRDGSYEYILQEASNFNAWVSRRSIHQSFQYTHLREPTHVGTTSTVQDADLFAIRRLPPPAAEPAKPKRPPLPAPSAGSPPPAPAVPPSHSRATALPTPSRSAAAAPRQTS
jgi:hypothetical protein